MGKRPQKGWPALL